MAKMTPAVMITMIDEEWKRRSLTSTVNNSRRTKSEANRSQIHQSGAENTNDRADDDEHTCREIGHGDFESALPGWSETLITTSQTLCSNDLHGTSSVW